MARFCSLFSSSSGNATYIGSSKTGILIDAGVSAKRIREALIEREIDPASLSAIFVTHEHSDHIKGIRVLASSFKIPVFATAGTLQGMESAGVLSGKFPVFELSPNGDEVGDLFVRSFKTPHDSNESCGFQIGFPDGRKAAVATDIGTVTNEVLCGIIGCDLVMLESNHDVGMLQNGSYPYYIKRRILSDRGHLSNESCAAVARDLVERGTTRLFLGHLSTENNIPALAYQTNLCTISESGAELGSDYMLTVNPKENSDDIVRF